MLVNKIGIVGSRTFNDLVRLTKVMMQFTPKAIISGGARGADYLAKIYAQNQNIKYIEFPAEWDKYGKSAGYRRNVDIVNASDIIVAFWDGTSRGTKHIMDIAREYNKPLYIERF